MTGMELRWTKLVIGAVFGFLLAGQVAAAEGDWRAVYVVTYGGSTVGELHRELRLQADSYRFSSRLIPKGMGMIFSSDVIEQISEGAITSDGGWRPNKYFYSNSSKPDKPHDFLFDWTAMKLSFATESVGLVAGLHDELSQVRALAQQIAAGDREINLQVLSGSKRRIYGYQYRVEGEGTLTVPFNGGGQNEEALLVTLTTSRGKYATRFWLSPARDYLPLRIERTQIKKQRVVVMQLIDFE
ncbi:MAG: hypothetical protein DRQ60_00770 [Gammaproteobacteria bacterium]|nr:MAG: hypothetical protein DRQ60_00770 [Gammaproteobacteria bacterium]